MTDTITVRGFAGTTPEHRTPSSGTEVTTLRLGSTPRWRNAHTGEWSSGSTNWYTIAAFGRLAQNVAESISKGDPIVVVGRPKVRQWENDDGVRGTDMEINAQSLAHDLNYGRTDFTKISSAISRAEDQQQADQQDAQRHSQSTETDEADPTGASGQDHSAQESGQHGPGTGQQAAAAAPAAEPAGWDPEPALQQS